VAATDRLYARLFAQLLAGSERGQPSRIIDSQKGAKRDTI